MPIALDAPQARVDVEQRSGHPPLFLITAPPAVHLDSPLTTLRHDRLQTIGGVVRLRRTTSPLPSY